MRCAAEAAGVEQVKARLLFSATPVPSSCRGIQGNSELTQLPPDLFRGNPELETMYGRRAAAVLFVFPWATPLQTGRVLTRASSHHRTLSKNGLTSLDANMTLNPKLTEL